MATPELDATVDRDEAAIPSGEQGTQADQAEARPGLVEEELLVEDVSIDGMCGVY